jgi:hypothetical protein
MTFLELFHLSSADSHECEIMKYSAGGILHAGLCGILQLRCKKNNVEENAQKHKKTEPTLMLLSVADLPCSFSEIFLDDVFSSQK